MKAELKSLKRFNRKLIKRKQDLGPSESINMFGEGGGVLRTYCKHARVPSKISLSDEIAEKFVCIFLGFLHSRKNSISVIKIRTNNCLSQRREDFLEKVFSSFEE